MVFVLTYMYEGVKLGFICVLALFAGGLTELAEAANAHPAITSVLAGGFVALAVRFVDKWLEGRNKTIKTADKVLELEQQEKKELRDEHTKLMAAKEAWWNQQADRLKVEMFAIRQQRRAERTEASEINHKAINELMRLQNIILGMQRSMVMAGLTVPEAAQIDLTKFMLPVWESERDEDEQGTNKTVDAKPGKQD